MHPHATELLFAIGASNMLVGRTDDCDYPQGALRIPSIGKTGEINKDMVAVLEPDVVFIGPGQELDGYKTVRVAPKTLSDLYATISQVGETLSKQIEADMLVHDIKATLDKIKDKSSRFVKTKVLLLNCFESFERPPMYFLELASIAGGEPYIGDDAVEQIQHFDPRMVVVVKQSGDDDEQCLERLSRKDGWSQVKAVKQELLFVIDEGLFRPSPRLIEGAKRLAMILHGVAVD